MAKFSQLQYWKPEGNRTKFQYVTKENVPTWNAIHNQTNVKTHFSNLKNLKKYLSFHVHFSEITGTYLLQNGGINQEGGW